MLRRVINTFTLIYLVDRKRDAVSGENGVVLSVLARSRRKKGAPRRAGHWGLVRAKGKRAAPDEAGHLL